MTVRCWCCGRWLPVSLMTWGRCCLRCARRLTGQEQLDDAVPGGEE